MIQRVSHASIYVLDQDVARDFYVNKLGFEIRMDQSMDNGFRWLTVSPKGQPDFQLILMKVDGPNIKPRGRGHAQEPIGKRRNGRWRVSNRRLSR